MCLKAYLHLENTEVVLLEDYPLSTNLVMLNVYSGNRMQRTEMRARRKAQRKEKVCEVCDGMGYCSGNAFTHTLLDYLVRISSDKITHLVCEGS